MKYIFIVQGEGRGHMTQAITLFQLLQAQGHEVSHVIVGKSNRREIPYFFSTQITAPITPLDSPNFVTDADSRSVNIWKTLTINIRKYRSYLRSVQSIHTIVQDEKPDAMINFYDFLGGLYFLIKKPAINHIAIAHQFLLNHSAFEFPKGRFYDKTSLLAGNWLASYGTSQILALSFQPMPDEPEKKLYVVPPLLRRKAITQPTSKGSHLLVYMVNHGYYKDVIAFHKKHPQLEIHCFWDKKDEPTELHIGDTLTFHQLDDEKFLSLMASCHGYQTTAGFESVCEAMYMGKPVSMVPVEGHYEQACNALDAEKAGAGVSGKVFDLELLLDYLPKHQDVGLPFREWCHLAEEKFIHRLA